MEKGRELLDSTDLFGGLPANVLEELAGTTSLERRDRGEVICRHGEIADAMWIVFSGRVAVSHHAPHGRETVMAILGPGALFGEMSLIDGALRSADARALTSTNVIRIPYEDVRVVVQTRPEVLWPMTKILVTRLRRMNEVLADAMFLDVTGRTAKRLLEIAGTEDEFKLPITQEELAAMVGASRERVNKAIATFTKLGWIGVSGRSGYRILDRAELEARAGL